jgi:hypothetical protein
MPPDSSHGKRRTLPDRFVDGSYDRAIAKQISPRFPRIAFRPASCLWRGMNTTNRRANVSIAKVLANTTLIATALLAAPAMAAVSFSITNAQFVAGAGYGTDGSESVGTPTLLGVQFSTSGFVAQSFSLNLPSPPAQTFLFGTVNFVEPNSGGGILTTETDFLGVTANFTFVDPLGGVQPVTAVGVATAGSVSDVGVDYTLTWTPLTVNFGVGGQFRIDLATLSFTGLATADNPLKNQNATITLLALPQQVRTVPEPGTLLLLGTALAGLAWRARRR